MSEQMKALKFNIKLLQQIQFSANIINKLHSKQTVQIIRLLMVVVMAIFLKIYS